MNEPTKVYIVTQGDYSDRRNIGVFTSREKAEAAGGDNIEEWLLDNVTGAPGHYGVFEIIMDREGNTRSVRSIPYAYSVGTISFFAEDHHWSDRAGCLSLDVWATDMAHAVKIVNEKRAQLIAENKWGVA